MVCEVAVGASHISFYLCTPAKRRSMKQMFSRCSFQLAKLLLPHDKQGVLNACVIGEEEDSLLFEIAKRYRECRRGSIEGRVIRAIMAAISRDKCVEVALRNVDWTIQ